MAMKAVCDKCNRIVDGVTVVMIESHRYELCYDHITKLRNWLEAKPNLISSILHR